jgi:predicted permease
MKKQYKKLLGLALLCTGAILVFMGYQMSGGLGSQFSRSITGSFSDKELMYFISGAVALIAGLFFTLKK